MKRILAVLGVCCIATAGVSTLWGQSAQNQKSETSEKANSNEALDQILAGHSYHGEAFNEGPRQAAYLMGGTGNVDFPVTTKSELAQAFINQGVGQLHGFWYLEAERSFRQAASLDPDCAMAYWGAALAAYSDRKRANGFAEKAVALKKDVTKREKMYIDSVENFFHIEEDKEELDEDTKEDRARNYLKALESIVLEFPDDLEAKAFVAHRIWHNGRDGIPVSSYLATDSLLNEIFAREPLHPSHHYTIHLWDYRKPEKALKAAARCGVSAPGIAHMWHMPGHIYSRLKRYEDAVYQQEASARVDHAHMMRDRVMPDEIINFAHNNEWLIRNLSFIGNVGDAVDLAKNMCSLPRHPKFNTIEKRGGSASYGRRRLLQILREHELFDLAIELAQSGYLQAPKNEEEQVKVIRLLGCSAAITNRSDLMQSAIDSINEILDRNQKEFDRLTPIRKRMMAAEKVMDRKESDKPPAPFPKDVDLDTLKEDLADVKKDYAKSKKLVSHTKKALDAIEGYRLVSEMDYGAARKLLKKATGEDQSWLGELHFLAGDHKSGLDTVQKQIDRRKNETIPLARRAHLLYQQYVADGKQETSKEDGVVDKKKLADAFQALRESSSSIDLSAPLFRRLAPVASELGLPENWNLPKKVAADIGFRPELDSLGPFRWSPSLAPEWTLVDSNDSEVGSADFAGQPHILIFYLGHGCLHCAEQLQAFGPHVPEFADAGIEMVAISSDGRDGLSKSIENYVGEMPFQTLVADETRSVFKDFRAFDDFEDQPLHGTFLIDGDGRIRWQDISYEPFMDHEFLLAESKRLLEESSKRRVKGQASNQIR